jgi:hypothetical protein
MRSRFESVGDATDRRARGRRAALLLQSYRRRQPLNLIHLRRTDLMKKAPRIRRDRFQIPPLRLGVERAERQRGFPRPRDASEDNQRIAWNLHVDVLEIVLPRATHADKAGTAGGG